MNIGSLSRPLSYPFMTPSAGLVEGMGSLSLIEYDWPWLLPPYQLPCPSLRLALDKGLLVLHPSLPLVMMTPPSSPTPLSTPPPTCSVSKGECSKQHKDWMDLYGLKKRGQCCRPSSPITRAKRESMSLFWKLEREIGLQEALECFQKAVRKLDLSHLCFSLKFYFIYVSLAIFFYVSFTNLFSIILFLICWLPETLKTKEKQDSILLIQETV